MVQWTSLFAVTVATLCTVSAIPVPESLDTQSLALPRSTLPEGSDALLQPSGDDDTVEGLLKRALADALEEDDNEDVEELLKRALADALEEDDDTVHNLLKRAPDENDFAPPQGPPPSRQGAGNNAPVDPAPGNNPPIDNRVGGAAGGATRANGRVTLANRLQSAKSALQPYLDAKKKLQTLNAAKTAHQQKLSGLAAQRQQDHLAYAEHLTDGPNSADPQAHSQIAASLRKAALDSKNAHQDAENDAVDLENQHTFAKGLASKSRTSSFMNALKSFSAKAKKMPEAPRVI